MTRKNAPLLLLLPLTVLLGCPPKRDLSQQQVKQLGDLKELMWFLATVADPGFKSAKKEPGELADADYARFTDMGRRVPWAAARLQQPPFAAKGEGFVAFARQLDAAATKLTTAAKGRAGADAVAAAQAMKQACAGCHRKYR